MFYCVWAADCLAQGCLQQWRWKWCLGRAVEPGCFLQSAHTPQQAHLGKSQGHIPSLPFSICLWTCYPGIYLIPLWPCWCTLPPQPPTSAGSTSALSQCKEVLSFFHLIHHLHDFINLSQASLSLPLSKWEFQPLSFLFLRQLLHLRDLLVSVISVTPLLLLAPLPPSEMQD